MDVALITLASTLAITEGYPRCFSETHNIKCQFDRKTKATEFTVRNFFANGTDWEDLINCWSDKLEECCRKSECFNTSDMVNITIEIKDRTGKIGCLMEEDLNNNSFCNLPEPLLIQSSPLTREPVLIQSSPLTRDNTVRDDYEKTFKVVVPIMIIIIVVLIIIIIILCSREKNNRCGRTAQEHKDVNENIPEKDKCLLDKQDANV